MIPRLLHLIWLGAPPPGLDFHLRRWRHWADGYDVRFHTDLAGIHPAYRPIAASILDGDGRPAAMAADLLRYSLLETHGGWYADLTDVELLKPLRKIHDAAVTDGVKFVCGSHAGWLPKQDVLAAEAGWNGFEPLRAHCLRHADSRVYGAFGRRAFVKLDTDQAWLSRPDVMVLGAHYWYGPEAMLMRQRQRSFPHGRPVEQAGLIRLGKISELCSHCPDRPECPFAQLSACSRRARILDGTAQCPEEYWTAEGTATKTRDLPSEV